MGGGHAHEKTAFHPTRSRSRPAAAVGLGADAGTHSLHPGRARPDARADRSVSRFAAVAAADGRHLSARGGASGALVARAFRTAGRRGRVAGGGRGLGPERQVAGGLPRPADANGRKTRLDPAPRRCLPRAGAARDGYRAAPAAQGAGRWPACVRRAPARGRGQRRHRHRAGESARRVRALLRSLGRVRRVALARVPAGGVDAVDRLRDRRDHRVLLWRHRLASPPRQGGARSQSLRAPGSLALDAPASRGQMAACAPPCRATGVLHAAGPAHAAGAQRIAATARGSFAAATAAAARRAL